MQQTFADFQVGDRYEPIRSVASSGSHFNDDDNPWFHGPSPFGGPIAPLTLNNADFDRFLRANSFPMNGIFPVKTSREFYQPILLGSTVVTTCEVVETFERKGRHYVTFEFVTSDEQGKALMKKRDTLVQIPRAVEEANA